MSGINKKWLPPLIFLEGKRVKWDMVGDDGDFYTLVHRKGKETLDGLVCDSICRPSYEQDSKRQELYEGDWVLTKCKNPLGFVWWDTQFCRWSIKFPIKYEGYSIALFMIGKDFTRLGNANDAAFMAKFKAEHPELFE